jgi:hypothetical protein
MHMQQKARARDSALKQLRTALPMSGLVLLLLVMGFSAGGCARDVQSFRHPEADLSSITRVAVIPFENFTSSQYAGEKTTMIYISELLARIDIEVVEPGEVQRILQADNIAHGYMSQSEIRSIGSSSALYRNTGRCGCEMKRTLLSL